MAAPYANSPALTSFVNATVTQQMAATCPVAETAAEAITEFDAARKGKYASGNNVFIPLNPTFDVTRGITAQRSEIEVLGRNITLTDQNVFTCAVGVDQLRGIKDFIGGPRAMGGDPSRLFKNGRLTAEAVTLKDMICVNIANSLVTKIDQYILDQMRIAAFYTPYDRPFKLTKIDSVQKWNQGRNFMDKMSMPREKRWGLMHPDTMTGITDSMTNNREDTWRRKALVDGELAENVIQDMQFIAGTMSFQDPNITVHQPGPQAAVNPNFTVGSIFGPTGTAESITFSGLTSGTVFKAGDAIAIPSVGVLNRLNKNSVGNTLVIRVPQDTTSSGGVATVTLEMPLVAIGPNRNVDSLPVMNAACEMFDKPFTNNYAYTPMGVRCSSFMLSDYIGLDANAQNRFKIGKFELLSGMQSLVLNGTTDIVFRCAFTAVGMSELLVWMPSAV